jgi:hypothetical protein
VADEDDWFALHVEGALGHGNVVGVRERRILDDDYAVAVLLELVVDAPQPEPSTKPPCTRTTVPLLRRCP